MFYHLCFERCNDDIHLNCHREALRTMTLKLCSTLQSPEQATEVAPSASNEIRMSQGGNLVHMIPKHSLGTTASGEDSAELGGERFPARFSPTVLTSRTSTGVLIPYHDFPCWKQWSINKRKSFQQSPPPKRNILNLAVNPARQLVQHLMTQAEVPILWGLWARTDYGKVDQ